MIFWMTEYYVEYWNHHFHFYNCNETFTFSKVIAHAPMLDLGGLIKPGTIVRMTESKPGGKTSHAVQLVR